MLISPVAGASPAADWPARLQAALVHLESQPGPAFGVYVRDLATGLSVSHRADRLWYLASTVKVFVAIAVMREVQKGGVTLDTPMTLRSSDYVDGAGSTNHLSPGTSLNVRFLLDQMIIYSDNTASDMLIGLVGIDAVNAVAQSLVPGGFERITTLADVRRHIYSHLAPAALRLSGQDFVQLGKPNADEERVQLFSRLVGTPIAELRSVNLAQAYETYYASHLNSGRLDAYGEMLAQLATGQLLRPTGTRHLLETMLRVKTGQDRIKAGLPPGMRFAHKTGTQRERVCDSGIITVPGPGRERQLVIAACTRGEPSVKRAARRLHDIADALHKAGAL